MPNSAAIRRAVRSRALPMMKAPPKMLSKILCSFEGLMLGGSTTATGTLAMRVWVILRLYFSMRRSSFGPALSFKVLRKEEMRLGFVRSGARRSANGIWVVRLSRKVTASGLMVARWPAVRETLPPMFKFN